MADIRYEPLTHLSQGYTVARVFYNGESSSEVVVVDKAGNPTKKIKNQSVAESLLKLNCDEKGFTVMPFRNGVAMIKYRTPAKREKTIGVTHSGYLLSEETCTVAEAVYKKPEMLEQLQLTNNPEFTAEELNGLFDVAQHRYVDMASELSEKRKLGEISQEEFDEKMKSNLVAARQTLTVSKTKLQAVADKSKETATEEMEGGK